MSYNCSLCGDYVEAGKPAQKARLIIPGDYKEREHLLCSSCFTGLAEGIRPLTLQRRRLLLGQPVDNDTQRHRSISTSTPPNLET